MKVVILHGQNHQQTSWHIGNCLCNYLNPTELKEFYFPKDMPHFCTGCVKCLYEGIEFCPHHKEMKPILNALLEADLFIFTTPVYCLHTTGAMKSFLDHCFTMWMPHKPLKEMFFKKAVIIATGAGSGMKSAANDIKDSLKYWGLSDIKVYRQRSMASSWNDVKEEIKMKIDMDMKKMSTSLRKCHRKKHVSLRTKSYFYMMRFMQKKGLNSKVDIEYWQKQGWLDKKRPWK